MDHGVLAASVLESSAARLPGDDRPGRRRRGDREATVVAVESIVPQLAPSAGRDPGVARVPGTDGSTAAGGQAGPRGGFAVLVREDGGDLLRDPQGGGGAVDVRPGERDRPDE